MTLSGVMCVAYWEVIEYHTTFLYYFPFLRLFLVLTQSLVNVPETDLVCVLQGIT